MKPLPALRVVRAENPSPMTLDGTRTYIVGRERPVVIDPGPDDAAHLRALEIELAGAVPVAVLLTHAHRDHSAGAAAFAARTGSVVRMAPGALRSIPGGEAVRWLEDGEEVESDAGPLRAVATPGHAPEHLSFFWRGGESPGRGALFVGDLMMGQGDTTLVAWPEGNLADYLRSLQRVEQMRPGVLYPAHGPPLREVAAALERFRVHRHARIEQVRDAVRTHPEATVEALVGVIYGTTLPPALREAAKGSLRAVLQYLNFPQD